MKTEIINAKLVEDITKIIQEWNAANTQSRNFFHGWQQLSVLAGLEQGAYGQMGKAAARCGENFGMDPYEDLRVLGETAFLAYKRGGFESLMDIIRK